MSRGAFVRLAGVGAAGLATAGPARAAGLLRPNPTRINAGVLLPTGSSFARMGTSFLDGFRLGLDDMDVTASLVTRPVSQGYGGAYTAVTELASSGLDVLVAGVTSPIVRFLAPLVQQAQLPLVVANVGGHVPDPAEKNPFVVHNSLLYWQGSYALGQWATRHVARRAFVAAAFADS